MQRGKGAPGLPAQAPGVDWLDLSTYESLHQGTEAQQVYAAGGIVVGYVINNSSSTKPALGTLLPGTMICKRSVSSDDITAISFSFLVVDSEKRAKDMLKGYLATSHKRIAKVYFIAESKNIDSHVVCYEELTVYPLGSKDKSMPKGKRTWQLAIRQVLEALHELQKVKYGRIKLGKSENSKYLVYGKGEDADILKIISVVPLNKNSDEVKKRQVIEFLDLIEEFGVGELGDEYDAFRSLVENSKSYSMPTFLGHPFLLLSNKEKLQIVTTINEELHNLDWEAGVNYETYIEDQLLGMKWKEKVNEKGVEGKFVHIIKSLHEYKDEYKELPRFLRNFITHERDEALQRDINLGELTAAVYRPFGAFLSWTYTYIHKLK